MRTNKQTKKGSQMKSSRKSHRVSRVLTKLESKRFNLDAIEVYNADENGQPLGRSYKWGVYSNVMDGLSKMNAEELQSLLVMLAERIEDAEEVA